MFIVVAIILDLQGRVQAGDLSCRHQLGGLQGRTRVGLAQWHVSGIVFQIFTYLNNIFLLHETASRRAKLSVWVGSAQLFFISSYTNVVHCQAYYILGEKHLKTGGNHAKMSDADYVWFKNCTTLIVGNVARLLTN